LFDALNCETLSTPVVAQLGELTKGALLVHLRVVSRVLKCSTAMATHDRELALAIHVDMLTRSSGEDITLWMSGVKQLIMRL
jgi:protein transport protein SEC31